LLGLGAVGAFLAVDLGAVAYANKWIGPNNTLTRETFLDAFRSVFGLHPGFGRNHAKGVVVRGHFDSNGNGSELSKAAVFRPGQTPVAGRFSLAGGDPNVVDTPAAARGLGLAFAFPDGTQWRTAMLNLPVFPDNSAQGFYDRLFAQKVVPATGQPDPAAMAAFLAAHPETGAATALIKQDPPTRGFAESTFSGLITFFFVNDAGARTPVRWSFDPPDTQRPTAVAADPDGRCTWRSTDGCHAAMAERSPHRRRRSADVDGHRDRGGRQRPRHQLRPTGPARRHRTVR
jgi:catalase